QTECNGSCVNTQNDNQNCGACGKVCGSSSTCQNGACACSGGLLSCSGSCVASNTDNCGSCNNKCSSGQVCNNGQCSSAGCGAGSMMCSDGACSSNTDAAHCGTSCTACGSGSSCSGGTCTCTVTGQQLCSGTCIDTTSNTSNCGSCGHACTSGQTCTNGTCTTINSTGTGGSGSGTGGSTGTGGAKGGSTGTGGSGSGTGGSTGTGGSSGGCTNTNMSVLNEDASGYVCNNNWGIQGAWYCYSDGSDSTISCKGSNGKGMGAIPWNSSSNAMCLSGTMGTGSGSYAGIGFKVNSGPPGSTTTPGTWNASNIVGFAVTLAPGASGKGSGGMILNLEYPTSTDLDTGTQDAPGITVPGVPTSGSITYNALFSDSVLANDKNQSHPVDPANLTDVKIAFFPDSVSHTYDFCIKSVVPIMSKPSSVVATGTYGPTWNNQQPQATNGINGYAV